MHRARPHNNPMPVKEAFQSRPPPPKPERNQNIGKMFPVTMSYVSIQGSQNPSDEPGPTVPEPQQQVKKVFARSGTYVENNSIPAISSGLKMDRSRTIMNNSRRVDFRHRGVKITIDPSVYSGQNAQNVRDPPDLTPSAVSIDRHVSKKSSNTHSAGMTRAIVNDLNTVRPPSNKSHTSTDVNSKSSIKSAVQFDTPGDVRSLKNVVSFANSEHYRPPTKSAAFNNPSDSRSATGERPVTYPDKKKGFRDTNLPKPELPSQQYLEGAQTSSPWASRLLSSPRNSQDMGASKYDNADLDALTRR